MATPTNTPVVKQIRDSANALHDIAALYLTDGTNYYSPEDLLQAGVDYTVLGAGEDLPAPGATYKGKIYLKPDASDVEGGSYIEYICVNNSGTWSWEPIGTTKINVAVSDVSTAKDTVTVQYDKVTAVTTSLQPAVTVNGSNFTFTGTSATVSVSGSAASHTHSIGAGTKGYFTTETNVPKTFNTTSVVSSLKTANITPVAGSTAVLTGYEDPTTASVVTGVTGTTTRYKTQSITPTNGSETVAKAGSATTVATGLSGDVTFVKTVGDISTTYLAKSNIYPAADVTAITTVTGTTATLASKVGSEIVNSVSGTTSSLSAKVGANVMNTATVSSDGVLSFSSTAISGNVVTEVTSTNTSVSGNVVTEVSSSGESVRGTSVPYLTGATTSTASDNVLVAYGKGTDTTGTVSATTISITPVNGTTSVAKVGSAVTVVTSGTTTTGGVALITAVSASGTTDAITGLGTASTTNVATAGSATTVVTGASTTANAYTGIASSVTLLKGLTTTSNSNGTVITALPTETGSADAAVTASGDFKPAGTIGGTQSIEAHNHAAYVTVTATSATVNVTGHTHVVTLSGGSVNNG